MVPPNLKLFINSGEFYGTNPRTANLELLARFFTKYPHLADRTFLSVKVRISDVMSVKLRSFEDGFTLTGRDQGR